MKIKASGVFLSSLIAGVMMASSAGAGELSEQDKMLVSKAQTLLQERLGSDAEINMTAVEKVTWPDGSMGCPKAGMNYTQALVDGYRVVLESKGREYAYHGRKGGEPFYCANPGSSNRWIMDR